MEALGGVFQESAGNSPQGKALRTPSLISSSRVYPRHPFSLPSIHSQPLQVLQQARILPQDTPMMSSYMSDVRMPGCFKTVIFLAFYKLHISLVFID